MSCRSVALVAVGNNERNDGNEAAANVQTCHRNEHANRSAVTFASSSSNSVAGHRTVVDQATNTRNEGINGAAGDTQPDTQPTGIRICRYIKHTKETSQARLKKELMEITMEPPPHCSAGLTENNIYEWAATIIGPQKSVYEDGIFSLQMQFNKSYPFKPPRVKFLTPIYHCNIDAGGEICLDILAKKWSPALTISNVLLSICSLLTDCNPYDPLVAPIAQQYMTNRAEHDRIAKIWTKNYAV